MLSKQNLILGATLLGTTMSGFAQNTPANR